MKTHLIEFIEHELSEANKAVRFRKESQQVWAEGTDASWRSFGCKMSKEKRMELSAMEGRILVRIRHREELFEQVLRELKEAE